MIIPKIIFNHLTNNSNCPESWDVMLDIVAHATRHVLGNKDWKRIRAIFVVTDLFERLVSFLKGIRTERIIRKLEPSNITVEGIWVVEKTTALPNVKSDQWKDTIVYFWSHGKTF